MNLTRADGSVLIAYANSRADTNDILEELLEAYIKHQLNTNPAITEAHLAAFLTEVDKHLPGKSILPKNKKPGEYTRSDLVEAYSRLALASYIYQEAHLLLSPGGHQLLQNIGKILDTAHVFKTIGDAWHTYANSPEGKAHLANGGKQLADILRESGFKVGSLVAQAKATAQQQIETIEAANWQPDIEAELDALLEEAEAEEQLAEINEQEAAQPITIPAEESITGQPITIEPQQEETIVNSQSSIVNPLLSLIQQGKAKTQDFARFFRDNPAITDAEATEQGIRPLTQRGTPTAAYTQGRLIAAKLTPQQFDDYINGKLKGKALKQALSKPADPTHFSIKAGNPTYTVINDNVGLQQHLDDIATPVEINFSPDSEKNWIKEAKKYLAQLAGKIYILENTDGYSVKMPDSHIGKASAVKGIRKTHQFKAEVINKFEELFSRVVLLNVEAPSHKENESKARAKRVDASAAFYKFGWPVRINGTLKMFWFGADQFKNANEKELAFYEFGLQDINEKGDSAVRSMHPKAEVKQGTESPSSEETLGDYLANVKLNPNKDRILPEIIKNTTSKHGTSVPTTANFSIKPAAADTLDRFTVDPLGERIIHHIRTESRRYSRLLGDKTPYEQAVNAAQSAASIIGAVDKFLHTPGKPVPARYRRQLQKLRSIAEKYAQIIASGTPRSFKKISPQEKQELEAAIAELEAQELDTATTESDQLLTDSDRLTKREAAARAREHHRAIVRSAAKGRVYKVLAAMLDVTADALDSYLKHQLLQKLDRLTATVKIKRSPSKRLQGKMTAPAYRELERAINNMALSPCAHETGMAQLNSTSMPS